MAKPDNPFRYFNSSPEVIRLVVMMYIKFPLSLRNVEDLLAERGIDVSYETIRFWCNRDGPLQKLKVFGGTDRARRAAAKRNPARPAVALDLVCIYSRALSVSRNTPAIIAQVYAA